MKVTAETKYKVGDDVWLAFKQNQTLETDVFVIVNVIIDIKDDGPKVVYKCFGPHEYIWSTEDLLAETREEAVERYLRREATLNISEE